MDSETIRHEARSALFTGPTAGHAPGMLQLNLVALPKRYAFDFLLFAQRNPKPVPMVEVLEAGRYESRYAPGSDVRSDLPRYRIFMDGHPAGEVLDAREAWREDFITFLIGCSFTFEAALERADIPVRHVEEAKNVPMYITNRATESAGLFSGPLVVSMRPIPTEELVRVTTVTARYPRAHGAPLHIGDPAALGILSLDHPDFGQAVTIKGGEVPVFWGCGVTPQLALQQAKVPLAVTHAPGHMFVTDTKEEIVGLEVL